MLDETWVGINFLESFRIVDGMVVVDRVRASASKTRVRAWDLGDLFTQYPEGRQQDIRSVLRDVARRPCSHFPSQEA